MRLLIDYLAFFINELAENSQMTQARMTVALINRNSAKIASYCLTLAGFIIAASILPVQYINAQENPDGTFTLNLKNADIHSLIETVSIRTGRNFIVDPRVKATVNIVSSETLDADRLYEVFLSVLDVHGYAAVQAGPITKIVPSSVGVQSAVPLLSEHSDTEDELVSQVIHLESMPALQVVEALRPLLPEPASISAESTSNSVVITDRAANIEKLIDLITRMDGR